MLIYFESGVFTINFNNKSFFIINFNESVTIQKQTTKQTTTKTGNEDFITFLIKMSEWKCFIKKNLQIYYATGFK